MYIDSYSTVTLNNCDVNSNTAAGTSGGGIFVYGSSEVYATINGASELTLRNIVDRILEAVGYAERFDDLFSIEYIPHGLFLTSSMDEDFEQLYAEYDVPDFTPTITEEDLDRFIYDTYSEPGISSLIDDTAFRTRLRITLEKRGRRELLWEKLYARGITVVFEDTDYSKPVSDISIVDKRTGSQTDICALMQEVWSWDTWDYN